MLTGGAGDKYTLDNFPSELYIMKNDIQGVFMKKYIPIDLAFEHYSRIRHHLNAREYTKILAELCKPKYCEITEGEALALYSEGKLVIPDKVRVVWMHDIERPDDNFLAHEMAELEHRFGFRTSYNIRMISLALPRWAAEIDAIRDLGHDIQYQHEDLVESSNDIPRGLELFKMHLAEVRKRYPSVTAAFGHGVYGSGINSADLFKDKEGNWHPEWWQQCGLEHPQAELYCFMDTLHKELGEHFRYFGEAHCIGGDEFVQAISGTRAGDVVFFLQHPTWWADDYDLDELKYIFRESPLFC